LELSGYNAERLVMSLESELKRIVDTAVAELTAAARHEADEARQQGVAEGRAAGWEDGREHGRFEGRQEAEQEARAAFDAAAAAATAERSSDLAASERLVDAIRAIDRARSLSEILDTLVGCAGREAARAGVLLVRNGHLTGWRFVGFPDIEIASTIDLALADGGVIVEAVRTGSTASGETGANAGPPPFAQLAPGHESLAIPIAMGDDVVAVLYADQGESTAHLPAWPETLEVLARHAARCLEALTALKAARALTERPGPSVHVSDHEIKFT
jgi:hypothetical protein